MKLFKKNFLTSFLPQKPIETNKITKVTKQVAEDVKQVGHEMSAGLMPAEVLKKSQIKEKVMTDGTIVRLYRGEKVREITPQGVERRFFNGSISYEYTPDKTCKVFKDNGSYVEEPWEYIDGERMSLSQAKHSWTGDHLGHYTLKPKYLKELERFIEKYDK